MGTTQTLILLAVGRSIVLWTKFENWNKNQSQIVDNPKEDLAKFGYRSYTQVNNIRILFIFWLHIGTIVEKNGKCFFHPSKILQITHFSFSFSFPTKILCICLNHIFQVEKLQNLAKPKY
jgi:hypothetical protein